MHERVHSAPNHRRVAEKPSSKREATTAATGMKVVRKAPCRWICKRGQFDQFSPGRPCECGGSGGGDGGGAQKAGSRVFHFCHGHGAPADVADQQPMPMLVPMHASIIHASMNPAALRLHV